MNTPIDSQPPPPSPPQRKTPDLNRDVANALGASTGAEIPPPEEFVEGDEEKDKVLEGEDGKLSDE